MEKVVFNVVEAFAKYVGDNKSLYSLTVRLDELMEK